MNIIKLVKLFQKLAGGHHTFVKNIPEESCLNFPYDDTFKKRILENLDSQIIKEMIKFGDINLGFILKRVDDKLFDLWFEQFAKKYSPLSFPEFEDSIELKYGKIFDNISNKIIKTRQY